MRQTGKTDKTPRLPETTKNNKNNITKMAAKDFIVAIELGSSKVTGIAGKKNLDGSITVLAIVKENSSSFIRKGTVYNIEKTAQCITGIIGKMTTKLKTRIDKVYIGIGGQSIYSIHNVVPKDLPANVQITQSMIDELSDANRNMEYPDQEILDVAIQEYLVDNQLQTEPVGVQCSRLEGNYLTILQRKAFFDKLNNCLELAKINVAEMFLAPLALADSVLTETERRSGCALVDIGADTTTVSVYSKNILRHLAVIPLGSNNITKDIASLKIEESEAEKLKLKHACAYTESKDIDENLMIPIDADHSVESKKFIDIVEGRVQEIVENVIYQIPQRYSDSLLGGLILTGGGSNMANIDKAFTVNHQHIEKIRIAKTINQTINSTLPEIKKNDGTLCTILGLLAKGDINCAGGDIDGGLFDTNQDIQQEADPRSKTPRTPKDVPPGTVLTAAEKRQAEKEEERKRAEEETRRLEQERLQEEEERRIRRENNVLHKLGKNLLRFGKKMIAPPEEE